MGRMVRSLADDLRARSDEALRTLVRRRPDLATPPPSDVGALAARSVTQAATARALDHLTRFELQVLEAVVVVPEPFTLAAVRDLVPDAPADDIAAVLDDLVALALVWGEPDSWRPTATVREVMGRFPAGLGPSLDQLGGGDPDALVALLSSAPPDARQVVDSLTWHQPTGRVRDAHRRVDPATASTPVEWLLAHEILRPLDKGTVVLPREVALLLRDGRLHQQVDVRCPDAELHHHDPRVIDRLSAATAAEAVRQVQLLLDRWAVAPPGVLRSGGLGVRELRAAAAAIDVDEGVAALLVEVAWAAGLLATSGEIDDEWLPTPAYDAWRTADASERWTQLAEAWLTTARVAGLVGERDGADNRINALTADVERIVAPDIRTWVLDDLATLDPGTAASVESMVHRHVWRRPRRGGRLRDDLVRWTLHEANALGICARGAVSSPGRALLAGDRTEAVVTMHELMPVPVDHVLLQADLTAVAPGPLHDDLARRLALMADVESSGGATVYRFTARSVQRALDAGHTAAECHAFLEGASRTPVPQPLTYLVDDVARRHGLLRVGSASSYLRCDDPAVLDELVAGRGIDGLRLRRLAPTVAVSPVAPELLVDRLRGLGLSPAAESADGSVVVSRPDERRTGPRSLPQRLATDPPAPSEAVAAALVRALRAGERGAGRGPSVPGPGLGSEVPRTAMAQTLRVLQDAVDRGASVWLGYVDNDGVTAERVVDPVTLVGGQLTAFDHRSDAVRRFSVHRVTGVAPLASEP